MRFAVLLAMAAAGCSDSLYTALFDARGRSGRKLAAMADRSGYPVLIAARELGGLMIQT
jgi:hypothetical protein